MSLAGFAFPIVRPLLHGLDAETSHRLTIRMLRLMGAGSSAANVRALGVKAFGLDFPNPLGLAAGFDKNAEVPDAMLVQGFGFVEVGSVTPRPQEGNPRPRLFRLSEDRAVINRMGFNNEGHPAVLARLKARRGRGIVGVNLGANKDSADRIADYVQGIEAFAGVAEYLVVNVSSPNTPGLRALQTRDQLQSLLSRLNEARVAARARPPMLLKLAPDLDDDELKEIASCCGEGAVDGIVVSNTTVSRPLLRSPQANESGGLSGAPLFQLSTRVLAKLYLLTRGKIPLIGVGGISDAETAWIKLTAGASLLQLYSALVYRGPGLVAEILDGLATRLQASGASSLTAITGRDAERIAHHGLSGT